MKIALDMSRVLGIDYGDHRTGLALSDPTKVVATPFDVIHTTSLIQLIEEIELILVEEDVDTIVLGLPLSMSGVDSEQTTRVRLVADRLKRQFDLPVVLEDERLSSKEVEQAGVSEDVDAAAAQRILQGYLDRMARAA